MEGLTSALDAIMSMTPAERTSQLVEKVCDLVGQVAGAEIGPDDVLLDSGMDSLSAVEMFSSIEGKNGGWQYDDNWLCIG